MHRSTNSEGEKAYSDLITHKYSEMAGAEQIASRISINTILFLLRQKAPREILELGAGIGTITETILANCEGRLTSVENNPWCRAQLQKNIAGLRGFTLINEYESLNSETNSDFICIDVNNGIFNVETLNMNSPHLKTVFIEGHHLAHRLNISKMLLRTKRIQKLFDVREKRGKKGCAYFVILEDRSIANWRSSFSFLITFFSLHLALSFIKLRSRVGLLFNFLERYPGMKRLRKLWKGKISWNF
jgi:hypothetical protein